jgi:uncharacterized C2H2 Zn-finger protein
MNSDENAHSVLSCRKFKTTFNLQRHENTVHEAKTSESLACPRCDAKFRTNYNLQDHMKTHLRYTAILAGKTKEKTNCPAYENGATLATTESTSPQQEQIQHQQNHEEQLQQEPQLQQENQLRQEPLQQEQQLQHHQQEYLQQEQQLQQEHQLQQQQMQQGQELPKHQEEQQLPQQLEQQRYHEQDHKKDYHSKTTFLSKDNPLSEADRLYIRSRPHLDPKLLAFYIQQENESKVYKTDEDKMREKINDYWMYLEFKNNQKKKKNSGNRKQSDRKNSATKKKSDRKKSVSVKQSGGKCKNAAQNVQSLATLQ